MTRQITSPRHAALDPALERVLARHADLVDASTPNNDLIDDHQRARVRRLMIGLFRAAAGHRARQYSSYSELPGHPDGPILGRATLDRKRFVRIVIWNEGQGFSVFWKWADEDFTPARPIHERRNPLGHLPDRTELSICTDLARKRLTAVFELIRAYTGADLPDREAAEAFQVRLEQIHGEPFRQAGATVRR